MLVETVRRLSRKFKKSLQKLDLRKQADGKDLEFCSCNSNFSLPPTLLREGSKSSTW